MGSIYSNIHLVVVSWDCREIDGGVLALLAEALNNLIMWLELSLCLTSTNLFVLLI